MDLEGSLSNDKITILDSLLNGFRHLLVRFGLQHYISAIRALVHFGPWRVILEFLIRQTKPPKLSAYGAEESLLGIVDSKTIAEELHKNSVVSMGELPLQFVHQLRSITDRLPVSLYQHMYAIDESVRQLADDPAVMNVLREYFQCEPVLIESSFFITGPHEKHGIGGENYFHFDYAAGRSLNVFVYLNDVTMDSSYHVVAKGSHRKITVHDAFRKCLSDEEVQHRFGSSIQPILGSAGTIFFENTEAFHKRFPNGDERRLLTLKFSTHRSWMSYGRASKHNLMRRKRIYDLVASSAKKT
jgi:hypothetical protein|tara:strand:+ start:299 stop:1198 length:900 start_codon:yes stop_codon:yes gene_type:complete